MQGTTGHSTAKITSQHSLMYDQLIMQLGRDTAQQYAEANEAAIHFIAKMIHEQDISCDFKWAPAYVFTRSDEYVDKIEKEARAASSLGIKASVTRDNPLPFPVKALLKFDDQAQFHPLKYLKTLVKRLPRSCQIYEQTRAVNINEEGIPTIITGNGSKVTASKVIIASHYPFYDGAGLYFARIWPERSYIVGVTAKEKFPDGTFISAESPTRSLRSQPMGDDELILIAGEEHKTGQSVDTNTHYENLITFARNNFQVQDILYRWSTQDYMTLDGVPYIGRLTSSRHDLFVATGFKQWGMSNGTAAAMVLRDLILSGDSPWKEVFDPARFTPAASVANFVVQNANVAIKYVSGKLKATAENEDILPEQSRIIRVDGERVGAYRDEKGELHLVDTTCPHVGCELEWNSAEKSWDCPCHGSRFTYEGEIIEGPALSYLQHPGDMPNQVEPNILQ